MKKRRIIYVDASTINSESKVSIYDTENNLTHTLDLINISNNNLAEKYAVLNAILYIVKNNFTNAHILSDNLAANNFTNAHILSDNLAATQDKKVVELAKEEGISISWIPREINVIADKMTKLEATQKEKDWNILNCFYRNIFK